MASLPRIAADGSVSYVDERGLTASSYVPTTFTETDGDVVEVQPGVPLPSYEWYMEVRRGNIPNWSIVQKFGGMYDVAGTYTPLTTSGVHQTPQVAGAVALRVKAGNVNDDVAPATGAQEVTLQGLDQNGARATETIATNGTSASTTTTTTWLRLYRLWVSKSGSYASGATASHAAAIVIESGAAAEWASIDATGIPKGQSQIAMYATAADETAYLTSFALTTDALKPVDFVLFKRENILETAAPYSAKRTVIELFGIEGHYERTLRTALGPFPPLTDIGWMGQGASTPDVTVDFEMLIHRA